MRANERQRETVQGSPRGEAPRIRIALVLSAGGLRGAAHVGVFRRLVEEGIPIDAIVGVSAGAVIAAYYAAVGLDFDTLIGDAMAFRGRHLLTHSLGVRLGRRFEHRVERWCGVIPSRLRELDAASFDQLHHGIERLGIVCHDVLSGRPHYSSSGSDQRITLGDAVRASASIPVLFPKVDVRCGERALKLTDGGLSDPVPVAFARSPEIGATHIIVSDCRWVGRIPSVDDTTVWIRPRMFRTGSLWSPRHGLLSSVRAGELAVTAPILEKIRSWMDRSA